MQGPQSYYPPYSSQALPTTSSLSSSLSSTLLPPALYPPHRGHVGRALALEKAKAMAERDLLLNKDLVMSVSERNSFFPLPSEYALKYPANAPEAETPYAPPKNTRENRNENRNENVENQLQPTPKIESNKLPKPKKATPKPSAQKRTMLFEQTKSSEAKKGEIQKKAEVNSKKVDSIKKTEQKKQKENVLQQNRLPVKPRVNQTNTRLAQTPKIQGGSDAGSVENDMNTNANSEISTADLQSPSTDDSLFIKNPSSTAKIDQTKFERDEKDIAIKTIKQWHQQHPHAQPVDLAAVVGHLAGKFFNTQNTQNIHNSSPPPPPLSSSSSLPLPASMRIKKKPATKQQQKFKPPARKKDYRPPSRLLHPPSSSTSSSFINSSAHPPPSYSSRPPIGTFPPPPPFPSEPYTLEGESEDNNVYYNNDNNDNNNNNDQEYEFHNQTSQTDIPPPPRVDMGTNTYRPLKRSPPRKKRDHIEEWLEAQKEAGTQVRKDWTQLRTQQPLTSRVTQRMGRNAMTQVDTIAQRIVQELCAETALLLTDMEREQVEDSDADSKGANEILFHHQLATQYKHIFEELAEYEKEEKQIVADTHHELITQAQREDALDQAEVHDPLSFVSSPVVPVVYPPVEEILAGVKEYTAFLKKKNGGADPVAIANMVAENILNEIILSAGNDVFSVCDSYVDRIVKSEFVV